MAAQSGAKRDDVYAAFKDAIARDPYDSAIYFDGAAALAASGQTLLAEKLLGAYAALLPKSARYELALARLLLAKNDLKGAAAAIEAAVQADPTNAATYFEQGRLAQKRGDAKGAREAYEKALSLRDDYPEVFRQLASLFVNAGDGDGALAAFGEALKRYRAAHVPEAQLEAFYSEVRSELSRANQSRKAEQWLKEARAQR
jgi:tetratricopeptide (TPR) repeat protein